MNGPAKLSVLLSLFMILSLSCAAKSKLPSWVVEPEPDNAQFFYGVGQGSNLANAKQAALEAIAGKLLTQIESTLIVDIKASNEAVDEKVNSSVRSQISNTNLSGYEVDKVKKIKGKYWVKISISKQKLYDENWKEYNDLRSWLQTTFKDFDRKSVLALLDDAPLISKKITATKNKLAVASAINGNLNYAQHSQKLTEYQYRLKTKTENLTFFILPSSDMEAFGRGIANLLADEEISATLTQPARKTPTIKIEGKFKEQISLNQKQVVSRMTIEVIDEYSNSLTTKEFNVRGSSLTSYENAKRAAANRFLKDLEIDGVIETIGLFQQ